MGGGSNAGQVFKNVRTYSHQDFVPQRRELKWPRISAIAESEAQHADQSLANALSRHVARPGVHFLKLVDALDPLNLMGLHNGFDALRDAKIRALLG